MKKENPSDKEMAENLEEVISDLRTAKTYIVLLADESENSVETHVVSRIEGSIHTVKSLVKALEKLSIDLKKKGLLNMMSKFSEMMEDFNLEDLEDMED